MNVYMFKEIAKLLLEWFDRFIFLLGTHDSPSFFESSLALGFIAIFSISCYDGCLLESYDLHLPNG